MKSMLGVAILTFATTMPLIHPAAATSAVSVSVTVRPTSSSSSQYQLLAKDTPPPHTFTIDITELDTQKTTRVGNYALAPGQHAEKKRFVAGYEVEFSGSLSRDAEHASWEVTVRRNGSIVTSQKSDTQLKMSPRA